MKRFIFSILAVTVFFLGLGSLVERTGAKFKSDEKALALIAKARQAIGGDAAINNIQSMIIVGRTTRIVKVNGVDQAKDGETEIAMQFPDKFMRRVKAGEGDVAGQSIKDHQFDVMVGEPRGEFKVKADALNSTEPGIHKKIVIKRDDGTEQVLTDAEAEKWIAEHPGVPGEKHVVIKKVDGSNAEIAGSHGEKVMLRRNEGDGNATFTTKDGKTFNVAVDHAAHGAGLPRHNDMLRFTLGLLLTSPKGTDVEYTFGGEANIEGTNCNVVVATFGGRAYKIFLDASSDLPVAMNFTGVKMPPMMTFDRSAAPQPADAGKDVVFFKKALPLETAEFQVRFSDYRSVNGVQLPFRWVQTIGGAADESFQVARYEINPANIAEKFQQQKGMMRMKKPEIQ